MEKIIGYKRGKIISAILCVIGILNIILNCKFHYMRISTASSITLLLTVPAHLNNAFSYKIEGKKKEFYIFALCCALTIFMGMFMLVT